MAQISGRLQTSLAPEPAQNNAAALDPEKKEIIGGRRKALFGGMEKEEEIRTKSWGVNIEEPTKTAATRKSLNPRIVKSWKSSPKREASST
jgi:hypothetical protein